MIEVCISGYAEEANSNTTNEEQFNDVKRVEYMRSYLQALADTMRYIYSSMHNKVLTYLLMQKCFKIEMW